jgi:uncharacterized protein (TIGR02271 family)
MQSSLTLDQLRQMKGRPVFDSSGQKIGGIEDIYLDDRNNEPEWVGLGTGFFGMKHVVVPLFSADLRDDGLYVPYSKDLVKEAPDVGDQEHVPEEKEAELYRYYDVRPGYEPGDESAPAESGRTQASADRGTTEGRRMTRSEEELRIGKREVPAGTVHLRKFVETEPVNEQVELRREKPRIERRPVNEATGHADIGEDEVAIPLTEEEAVMEKRPVTKEELVIGKDVETRTENVQGELRKERVEIDDETARRRDPYNEPDRR